MPHEQEQVHRTPTFDSHRNSRTGNRVVTGSVSTITGENTSSSTSTASQRCETRSTLARRSQRGARNKPVRHGKAGAKSVLRFVTVTLEGSKSVAVHSSVVLAFPHRHCYPIALAIARRADAFKVRRLDRGDNASDVLTHHLRGSLLKQLQWTRKSFLTACACDCLTGRRGETKWINMLSFS